MGALARMDLMVLTRIVKKVSPWSACLQKDSGETGVSWSRRRRADGRSMSISHLLTFVSNLWVQLSVVMHTCDPSTSEAEVRGHL